MEKKNCRLPVMRRPQKGTLRIVKQWGIESLRVKHDEKMVASGEYPKRV